MESKKLRILYNDWQKSVSDHAAMLRDVKTTGIDKETAFKLGRAHLTRIDAAFARLKAAETYENAQL